MSKDTSAWQPLVDAAVERLSASRRTFSEEEAMREVWEAGYEVSPQDDPRFVLAAEADGRHPHHWRLSTQALANNLLLDALRSGMWDGGELDQELSLMDAQDGVRYVFCPVDARFTQLRDGTYSLADGEPDIALPTEIKETLDALGPALLARWREVGATPWTTRVLTETVASLGWLRRWSAVARVGQDYWMMTDALPQGPAQTRLSVLPIRTFVPPASDALAANAGLQTSKAHRELPQDTSGLVPPTETPRAGLLAHWVETLRTTHLTQGFLPIPAAARSAAPPRAHEAGRWEVLRGSWFETGAALWVWLDREPEQLCGPDLADTLMWCEAGQKLRVDWNTDGLVLSIVGLDIEVQQEETRLVDLEALAALRGELGESYRRSLLAILSEAPQGMTFRELVEVMHARQGHTVHRGTIRTLLYVGGFVRREGHWFVALDNETGARQLRTALAQTLIETQTTEQAMPSSELQHLRTLARTIQIRLQEIMKGQ
ncbi:MAG TPA: hypothetical protein VH540_25160 [Ktedonobacterales bacterium]|jgi:hypothetical protein